MCEECACCHSPKIYCQYRSACVINMLTRQGEITPCADKPNNKQEGQDEKVSA